MTHKRLWKGRLTLHLLNPTATSAEQATAVRQALAVAVSADRWAEAPPNICSVLRL